MPFGLTNAPSAFQQFVNMVFADMLDVTIIVYLDDILIYSDNLEDHKKHIHKVLRRLCKHSLYAKPEKCEFHMDTTEYLGYCLSPAGLTMAQNKVDIIRDWPKPRKVKDIQSFLSFANFYRHLIYNYSDIVVPLTRLMQKDAPWNFFMDCRCLFNSLTEAFTSAPILTHYQPNVPIIVETNASDYTIMGILSNICPNGEIRPVAFSLMVTLSGGFHFTSRRRHQPQKPSLLLHIQSTHATPGSLVGIPPTIQPSHSLPPR